jgi:hypothetical protein
MALVGKQIKSAKMGNMRNMECINKLQFDVSYHNNIATFDSADLSLKSTCHQHHKTKTYIIYAQQKLLSR